MARVLITGASGLIGRRVVEAFGSSPDEVLGLRRTAADLRDPGAWAVIFDRYAPDTVVHLAWSASGLPGYRDHQDNWAWAVATTRAVELALDRGIRFIGTGTSVDELPAHDAYSRSKADVRAALAEPIAAGTVGWLRPFYVFDESTPSPAVLRVALEARGRGEPVGLASPHARHDFVHAKDVGSAVRTVVAGDLMGPIDIGSGATTSVRELIEAHGCGWVREGEASESAATDTAADVAGLRDLGWAPGVTDSLLHRS